MKRPNDSQASKSQTTASTAAALTTKKKIVTGEYSWMDKIFPLMDEMLKFGVCPSIINIFITVYLIFQIVSASFWPAFETKADASRLDDVITIWLVKIAFMSNFKTDKISLLITLLILTGLLLLIMITVIGQLAYYSQKRSFNRVSLSVTKVIFYVVPVLTLMPTANFIGLALDSAILKKETVNYIYSALGFIYFIIFQSFYYLSSYFISDAPYISTSPVGSWSGSFNFMYISVLSIILLISYLTYFFAKYISVTIVIVKILYNIYVLYMAYFLPFSNLVMNSIIDALYLSLTCADIAQLVSIFGISIDRWIIYAIIIGFFIIVLPLVRIYNKSRVRKVVYELTRDSIEKENNSEETETNHNNAYDDQDNDITQHYLNLNLDRSRLKCEMYCRIGMAYRCQLFLDFSLIKFIAEYHVNAHMYSLITQTLALFPSEIRLLSSLFTKACTQFELSYAQRFLMYQVNIIISLRQSSSSRDIAEKFLQIKNNGNSVIDLVRSFWSGKTMFINSYYDIYKKTSLVSNQYAEMIERWPNNQMLCESYSNFLIEGATDYKKGIFMKHRAELINEGKNFIVDYSFRSLIRAFPDYLKKNTMDIHGKIIRGNLKTGSSISGSSNSQMSTGTINGDLDQEIEERIGDKTFSSYRLRVALQSNLKGRRLKHMRALHISLLWNVVIFIIIGGIFVSLYFDHYEPRVESQERQHLLALINNQMNKAVLVSTIYWLKDIGVISKNMYKQMSAEISSNNEINLTNEEGELAKSAQEGFRYLGSFMDSIARMARDGISVRENYPRIIENIVPFNLCSNSTKPYAKYLNKTLKDITMNTFSSISIFAIESLNKFGNSTAACELFGNMYNIGDAFEQVSVKILYAMYQLALNDRNFNLFLGVTLPLVFTILTIPISIILIHLNLKELNHLNDLLNNLNAEAREKASKPILNDGEESKNLGNMETKKMSSGVMYFIGSLPLIGVIFIVIVPVICEQTNVKFNDLNDWVYYSISRSYFAFESIIYSLLAVSFAKGTPSVGITKDEALNYSKGCVDHLIYNNNVLLRGAPEVTSSSGHIKEFDEINLVPTCINDSYISDKHNHYHCDSLDATISYFASLMKKVNNEPTITSFENNSLLAEAFHIANSHIGPKTLRSGDLIIENTHNEIKTFRRDFILIAVSGVIVATIGTYFQWIFIEKMNFAYKGQLQQLRRVPPQLIYANTELMDYILCKKKEKKGGVMTPAKSMVLTSKDSVIIINKTLSVEMINNSIKQLFGYQEEQILGQQLTMVIPTNENEEFYNTVEMMKNGQCAMTFEKTITAFSDEDKAISVHVTLIGIIQKAKSTPEHFAVIMRDETELIEQRKSAEQAKEASEKLLYQILPRDIVTKINSGETNITFTVPKATIIFIDIEKFSEYSSNLSPNQIMNNLSIIFAKYDTIIMKYDLMTKIKLIGDIYMAAAGLFTPEEPPQNHASQVINFALECLQGLEEVNNQLDSNLRVRIGVNTNGPIIAGVLGTDKPVFDIIGDAINVAARLQSNGIHGTVQISESTYKLIQDMNYNVEKRGEIELKGKGKQMVYFIKPNGLSSFLSAQIE